MIFKAIFELNIEEEAAPLKCLFILNMSEFSPSTFQQSLLHDFQFEQLFSSFLKFILIIDWTLRAL